MIGIFKNNLFFNSLLLLPYLIVIRMNSFIYPTTYIAQESDSLLSQTIFGFFESGFGQNCIALLLIYYHVLFINRLVIKHRLSTTITLLPGLLYGLLVSMLPEYAMLSPHLIANTCILMALGEIYNLYKKSKAADTLFNIGLLVMLATLLVPNYIVFILLGVIGIFVLRSVKLNEIMQMFSGIAVVLFLFCGILYLLSIGIYAELSKITLMPKLSMFNLRGEMLYKASAIGVLAIFAVLRYGSYTLKKSIQVQKKIDILFWCMVVQLIMIFFYTSIHAHLALLVFVPLSILLSFSFMRIKNNLIQEIIHLVALVLLFVLNFGLI